MHTKEEKMEAFGRFLDIMDELRVKCPWDRKQTNDSLRPNTIEETYELCDALIRGDKKDICKELGDVLLHGSSIRKALFLSPVVNMERIIQVMMTGFGVTQERLEREQKIPLPIGKILDWSYYTYVKQHPVNFSWNSSIAILYGSRDALSPREEIEAFSHQYKATFTLLVDGEHYFASDRQLYFYKEWLGLNL